MMKSFKDRDETKKYYTENLKYPKNLKAGSHVACHEPAFLVYILINYACSNSFISL